MDSLWQRVLAYFVIAFVRKRVLPITIVVGSVKVTIDAVKSLKLPQG